MQDHSAALGRAGQITRSPALIWGPGDKSGKRGKWGSLLPGSQCCGAGTVRGRTGWASGSEAGGRLCSAAESGGDWPSPQWQVRGAPPFVQLLSQPGVSPGDFSILHHSTSSSECPKGSFEERILPEQRDSVPPFHKGTPGAWHGVTCGPGHKDQLFPQGVR